MRVRCLDRNERVYSSNVYFLLGDWSKIDDVNTLIDVGADPAVTAFLEGAPTGLGKRKVDLVILFGHGEPLTERCNERLEQSIQHVRLAQRLGVR